MLPAGNQGAGFSVAVSSSPSVEPLSTPAPPSLPAKASSNFPRALPMKSGSRDKAPNHFFQIRREVHTVSGSVHVSDPRPPARIQLEDVRVADEDHEADGARHCHMEALGIVQKV
jgi:hypothetical protein